MNITKNSISRKLVIISMAFLLYASSLLGSYNRSAHAIAPAAVLAAPVAAEVGMFIVSVVAAGIAINDGVNFVDNVQQNQEEYRKIYEKLGAGAKEGLMDALSHAYATGAKTIDLSGTLLDELYNYASVLVDSWATNVTETGAFTVTASTENWNINVNEGYGIYNLSTGVKIGANLSVNPSSYQTWFNGVYQSAGMVVNINSNALEYLGPSTAISGWNLSEYQFADIISLMAAWHADGSTSTWNLGIYANDSVIPNKDLWDSQIDALLTNPNTGALTVAVPDVAAYPIGLDGTPNKDISLSYNPDTAVWTYPDGTTYTGNPAIELGEVGVNTATGNPTVVAEGQAVDIVTGEGVGTTTPPGTGGGTGNPFTDLVPVAFMMAFLDLLKAILMYLARMFNFILTIPLIPAEPINNTAFAWFKDAKLVGVHIYNVVSSLASVGLAFMVYKAIRRLLP